MAAYSTISVPMHHPQTHVNRMAERPATTQYYAAGSNENKKHRMQRNLAQNMYASLDLQMGSPVISREEQ